MRTREMLIIDSIFLDGNELKTVVYDVDAMPDGKMSIEIYIIYGESKGIHRKII